jgi:hypothetical protein
MCMPLLRVVTVELLESLAGCGGDEFRFPLLAVLAHVVAVADDAFSGPFEVLDDDEDGLTSLLNAEIILSILDCNTRLIIIVLVMVVS